MASKTPNDAFPQPDEPENLVLPDNLGVTARPGFGGLKWMPIGLWNPWNSIGCAGRALNPVLSPRTLSHNLRSCQRSLRWCIVARPR